MAYTIKILDSLILCKTLSPVEKEKRIYHRQISPKCEFIFLIELVVCDGAESICNHKAKEINKDTRVSYRMILVLEHITQ